MRLLVDALIVRLPTMYEKLKIRNKNQFENRRAEGGGFSNGVFFTTRQSDVVTWIGVAQNRVLNQVFVKAVLKFRFL
jgi:hypothetical protein